MKNLLVAIQVLCTATTASARIINVPADYSSIQNAINVANSGDSIIIADGHYYERISFRGKAVVVGSEFLLDGDVLHSFTTVIDGSPAILGGGDSASVVTFVSSENAESELCGVTVQNGVGTLRVMLEGTVRVGGGIYCDGTAPVIRRCVFKNNLGEDYGGGMFSINGGPVIENCLFEQNVSSGSGGAICLYAPGNARVTGCNFIENRAFIKGGGIYTAFNLATVSSSTFERNQGIFGGALAFEDNQSAVSDCVIKSNTAISGGGIYCLQGADIRITNTELVDNTVLSDPATGGAVFCQSSSPTITNCTIVGNLADTGSAVFASLSSSVLITNSIIAFSKRAAPVFCSDASSALLKCSNVYGNAVGNWINCLSGQEFKDGNFSQEPEFCQANLQDYSLHANSPCLPDFNSCGVLVGARDVGCSPTDVTENSNLLPEGYTLSLNYPNPFNPTTRFDFELPRKTLANVSIFNSLGQLVTVLQDKVLSAGSYTATWDGHDSQRQPVSSGIYIYRLKTQEVTLSKRMILLK